MWSIGVGGFCFLLLCQVPSQRLLISVNLSCATTFSFPLPLSLSPICLTFPSFSLHISISLSLPRLTYSHCIYCSIPFLKAAADHFCSVHYCDCLPLTLVLLKLISHTELPAASRSESGLSHPQHRQQTGVFFQHFNDNEQRHISSKRSCKVGLIIRAGTSMEGKLICDSTCSIIDI